jgi:hypothetical protein
LIDSRSFTHYATHNHINQERQTVALPTCPPGKNMNKENSSDYFACLIRFWRENDQAAWRVTLENPHTTNKQHFVNPEQCWQYIQTILANSDTNHPD